MAASARHEILVIFDFDHTLVDDNTDTWITKLDGDVKELQKSKNICWTDRMSAIFKQLHEKKFQKSHFDKCLATLPFTKGMKELLSLVTSHSNVDSIIVSDSNTYFIDFILNNAKLQNIFSAVHSNPANWDDTGCLCIQHYHSHTCEICPQNLCKGNVLQTYIQQTNVKHQIIVYLGDGSGDYCPTLQLSNNDFIFARENYKLAELLQKNPPKSNPNIIYWKDGFDILAHFKEILASLNN